MLLLLSLPAGAVPYRALVVSSDEGIASLILSSLTLLSGEVTSPSACEEARARIEAEARIAEEQRISGYGNIGAGFLGGEGKKRKWFSFDPL